MREGEENQTFYGDGLTSEALQYQFYIFFKHFQEHWQKKSMEDGSATLIKSIYNSSKDMDK